MYELTCPSCERKDQLPFVRVGAVLDCADCGRRYQVDADHVANRFPEQAATLSNNPFVDQSAHAERQAAAPPAAPRTTGVFGESHPSGVNGSAVAGVAAEIEAAQSMPRPSAARRRRAERLRQKRVQGPVLGLLIALGALVLVMFSLIIVIATRPAAPPSPDTAGGQGDPLGPLPGTAGMPPMVVSDWVKPSGWREVEQPTPPNTASDNPLRLIEPQWLFEGDNAFYKATVACIGTDVYVSAALRLSLVDENETVYAQCEVPMALVGPERPVEVLLRVPTKLYNRMFRLHTAFEIGPGIKNHVVLTGTQLRPLGRGLHTTAEIETRNTTGIPLSGAVFLVSAIDRRNLPICQWRMDWIKPIGPDERVHFAALTGLEDDWRIERWEIFAVGEPDTERVPEQPEQPEWPELPEPEPEPEREPIPMPNPGSLGTAPPDNDGLDPELDGTDSEAFD